jgi:aryl-alcohol dehydrogenase-like predicted oxidoreductase
LQRVELGRTGLTVSRLAIGTGTAGWNGGSNQTRKLGVSGLASLLRLAHDLGVTFWDTADAYGSHPHVREALRGVDRDSVVITTKTGAQSAVDAERAVERYLRELRTDHLDVVLLHCMMETDWPRRRAGAMEALVRLKQRGIVGAVGVSCHHFGAFEVAADHPWVDVVLARINPAGVAMDAPVDRVLPVLERIHANGKGLYGMKILGQGRLAGDLPGMFRYALGLDCLDAIVVGFESERELRDDVDLVEKLDPVRV